MTQRTHDASCIPCEEAARLARERAEQSPDHRGTATVVDVNQMPHTAIHTITVIPNAIHRPE